MQTAKFNNQSGMMPVPVFIPDAFEPDDNLMQATSLAVPDASIDHTDSFSGDVDWFRFEAEAGRIYQVTAENLSANGDTILSLHDANGSLLVSNDAFIAGSGFSRFLATVQSRAARTTASR